MNQQPAKAIDLSLLITTEGDIDSGLALARALAERNDYQVLVTVVSSNASPLVEQVGTRLEDLALSERVQVDSMEATLPFQVDSMDHDRLRVWRPAQWQRSGVSSRLRHRGKVAGKLSFLPRPDSVSGCHSVYHQDSPPARQSHGLDERSERFHITIEVGEEMPGGLFGLQ